MGTIYAADGPFVGERAFARPVVARNSRRRPLSRALRRPGRPAAITTGPVARRLLPPARSPGGYYHRAGFTRRRGGARRTATAAALVTATALKMTQMTRMTRMTWRDHLAPLAPKTFGASECCRNGTRRGALDGCAVVVLRALRASATPKSSCRYPNQGPRQLPLPLQLRLRGVTPRTLQVQSLPKDKRNLMCVGSGAVYSGIHADYALRRVSIATHEAVTPAWGERP